MIGKVRGRGRPFQPDRHKGPECHPWGNSEFQMQRHAGAIAGGMK